MALLLAALLVVGSYALHMARPRFFDLGLWQLLFANLVGVLGGGYLALWANRAASRYQESRRREREVAQKRKRAGQALGALKKTIAHNRSELDDVRKALRDDWFALVFSTADPRAFDPVLSRLVETVDDLDLIRESATLRHQLEEFNRMAEAQLDLNLRPDMHPHPGVEKTRETKRIERLRKQVTKKIQSFGDGLSEKAAELEEKVATAQEELADAE